MKVATASLNDHFVFTIDHGVIVLASNLRRDSRLHLPALGVGLTALGAELTVLTQEQQF